MSDVPGPDDVRQTLQSMAIERREGPDRRDRPRGGRRREDQILLTAAEVLALAKREEFIALEVLAQALQVSRKTMLRDWESRRLPITSIGRRVWLASTLVLREYFRHDLQP